MCAARPGADRASDWQQRRIGIQAIATSPMSLLDALIRLFIENGYAALFVVLIICGMGVPIPEDVSLVAGGIIAGLGHADLRLMIVIGLAGVMVGDSVMFLLGHHFGPRVRKLPWIARVLTPRRYARVQEKFDRYGNRMLFFARFLPGLRAAVFLTAGMTHRVSYWRFVALDGLAALISVPCWIWLGYFGAERRDWLLGAIRQGHGIVIALVVLAVAVVGWLLWRGARRRVLRLHEHRQRRARRDGAAQVRLAGATKTERRERQ